MSIIRFLSRLKNTFQRLSVSFFPSTLVQYPDFLSIFQPVFLLFGIYPGSRTLFVLNNIFFPKKILFRLFQGRDFVVKKL